LAGLLDFRKLGNFGIPEGFRVFRLYNKEAAFLGQSQVTQEGFRHLNHVIIL
jgi:hypothetical protein